MPEIIIDEPTKKLLSDIHFEPTKDQLKLYVYKGKKGKDTCLEDVEAFVDFREKNGYRFAKRGSTFLKDANLIPILKLFKEERDKIENKLLSELGAKTSQSLGGTISKEKSISTIIPPTTPAHDIHNLYEFFFELVEEGGIIELFAETGFLKTTTCFKTICDALEKGKKAFFIDTEGKAGLHNKRVLKKINCYAYLPIWDDIVKAVETLSNYDLLVIDSLGFPISAKASGMDLHEQGKAWNAMMSLIGDTAKAWAFKNNAIVLFTNQPKSEMMKSEEELKRLNAVGDKVHFAPTIILKAVDKGKIPGHFDVKTQKVSLPETVVTVLSHRNPDFMDDTIMMKIYKQDENIRIEIPENVRERLKVLKQ